MNDYLLNQSKMNSIKLINFLKPNQMPLLLNILCSLIASFMINTTSFAQVQSINQNNTSRIKGEWEGNMVINESKSIGILWRFEKTDQGKLIGFMGPASKGLATMPMQDIKLNDSTLYFSIHSEGSYLGQISETYIKGIWSSKSGKKLVLYMARELSQEQLSERFTKTKDPNDIHQSIKLGDVEAVKIFLSKGDDINKLYGKGQPLLFDAIKGDRSNKVTKYLLAQGADVNINIEGITPLMYAVAYQNNSIVQELINHKVDINYISGENQSAVVFAIKGRNPEVLQLLIDNGGDPSIKIEGEYSAIDLAKEENIREILEVLDIPYEGNSDGPYVVQSDTGVTAIWVHKDKIHTEDIDSKNMQTILYEEMKASLWGHNPSEVTKLEYNGDFKLAAISDIHGQYDTFITLLKNNAIIDKDGQWNFGNGHFVVAGDIFDRGPQVTEVLWFLYDLEKQAEKEGGKLHVLLGNHDVMVLNGNLRSVHPKYTEIANVLKKPFNTLFNKGSVLGDWLRTRPVLVKINDVLFTHGGLHPDLVNKNLSIDQINSIFKQQLIESELPEDRNELGNYLHRKNGPIYYRGYFQGELATDQQINNLLKHFKISNIVVGHTTHKQIETRYNGKVIVIDANLKSGNMGEILLWENGEFVRGDLSGEKSPLDSEENN
jgi:hypothetical protein